MDLDTYALSYDAGKGTGSDSPAKPADSKGKGRALDTGDSVDDVPSSSVDSDSGPTFASDMQQLTTSLGSWWSGFSKQSAETFAQAQTKLQEASKNVNEQGGIVEYARKEAKRIERELEVKRREAKERVQKQEEEDKAARQKELDESREETQRTTTSATEDKPKSSLDDIGSVQGEEIFDADSAGEATTAKSSSAASTTTTTTLFDRLQSLSTDPRVASLQKDVTSRINSLNLFGSSATGDDTNTRSANSTDTLPTIFSDLSKSLSKLSSPETKELAKKYMKASEEVVGKVGEEWRDFLGELVRVVPPEQAGADESKVTASEHEKVAMPSQVPNEKVSKPDAQPQVSATQLASQPAPKAETTSEPKIQAKAPAAQTTTAVETTSKPEHRSDGGDDSDSDWE